MLHVYTAKHLHSTIIRVHDVTFKPNMSIYHENNNSMYIEIGYWTEALSGLLGGHK